MLPIGSIIQVDLSPVHTGDSPLSVSYCRRIRRQSPFWATVAVFSDSRQIRNCRRFRRL